MYDMTWRTLKRSGAEVMSGRWTPEGLPRDAAVKREDRGAL